MPEPGQPSPQDLLERYAAAGLSPAESREVAQQSLADPELFEELTAIALAKAAVSSPPRPSKTARPRRLIMWLAAAASIAVVAVYSLRPPGLREARSPLAPALADAAKRGQPMLLSAGLLPRDSPVFRDIPSTRRAPRSSGRIVSIEEGFASIDLGALDGLAIGDELQVYRDEAPTDSVGTLTLSSVFRDHAQALAGRNTRAGQIVRAPVAAQVRAMLDQTSALYARGDLGGARITASQAVQLAESGDVRQRAEAWNRFAVLLMLTGDPDAAGPPLRRAVAALSQSDPLYGDCANNLGVLAELANDRRGAAEWYAKALGATKDEPDRQVIESNLTRVRGSH